MSSTPVPSPTPPVARRVPTTRTFHGDAVVDEYEWLRDGESPEVIAHLEAENAYADQVCAPLQPLREALFSEIKERTQESDLSVPVAYRGWWYYSRTREGHQYAAQCRVPVVPGQPRPAPQGEDEVPGEQVVLDGDVEARGGEFFSVAACEVDLTGDVVAFAVDRSGDERFEVTVRRIADGHVLDEALTGVGYGLVWSLDSRYLFYTRVDDAWRPHEVWRHEVGTEASADVRVFAEPDERFWVGIGSSRDDATLVVGAGSKTTTEMHLLDLADPTGALRVVQPRREGVEYDVEPAGDVLLITHNANRADFEVSWAPVSAPGAEHWRPWLTPGEGERVGGVDAFATHVVVSMRSAGLTALRVVPWSAGAGAEHGEPWDVPVDEPVYSICVGANPDWDAQALRVRVESLVTPATVAEYDLATREATVLKRQPVLGGFDSARYAQERLWVAAPDGVRVPCSLVRRADVPLDGSAPALVYAYGAYEISMDPWFSIARLSLLDRGVIVVIVHARGGGEMGRAWYEAGRMAHKGTTFTDVLAAVRHLADAGLVDRARIGLEGGSAGGLMVGAVLNLDPGFFRVALAQVPFVDALTTMLDPSLPLTVTEREEWGDPLADAEVYAAMKGYTPYENIAAVPYPAILATTSLNDTRVSYVEPAKWVARLREVTPVAPGRPVLLRTEMVAGHGGRSGRYDVWEQVSWENAFLLDQLGAVSRLA